MSHKTVPTSPNLAEGYFRRRGMARLWGTLFVMTLVIGIGTLLTGMAIPGLRLPLIWGVAFGSFGLGTVAFRQVGRDVVHVRVRDGWLLIGADEAMPLTASYRVCVSPSDRTLRLTVSQHKSTLIFAEYIPATTPLPDYAHTTTNNTPDLTSVAHYPGGLAQIIAVLNASPV